MNNISIRLSPKLSFKEELANSIIHGLGSILMLCLLPISAIYAYKHYNIPTVIGICIFVVSLFLMFLSSTIYHSMSYGTKQKYILRVIDHSMIFIAIAGSYTPVAISAVGDRAGYIIIAIQWLLTIFGIVYKSLTLKSKDIVGVGLYLAMGWMAIFIFPKIIANTSLNFLILIFIGGVCYTLGVIFYSAKKPYSHTIWHLFILAAAICQYVGIVYFIK